MMAWNLFVIFAAAAFGFYVGENKRTIKGEKLFFVVCAGVALLWCAHRYSWEEIADSKRAYLVDGWSQTRIGVLFNAPRDPASDDSGRDRYSPF
jgi:hypothetical protein